MADLSKKELIKLDKIVINIQEIIKEIYGPTIVWEHGSAGCAKAVGGCLNHAHFNIFPISKGRFIEKVSSEFKTIKIKDIGDLRNVEGSYIFLKDSDGASYILTTDGVTPSQYFRKLVAAELGRSDRWDWRSYVGEEEFISTIKKLKPLF